MKYLFVVICLFVEAPKANNFDVPPGSETATVRQALTFILSSYGWDLQWDADKDVKTGEILILNGMSLGFLVRQTLISSGHKYQAYVCANSQTIIVVDQLPSQSLTKKCSPLFSELDFINRGNKITDEDLEESI